MLDIVYSYKEEELLNTLFSVQKFECHIKYGLCNHFSIEEIHLIADYYINNDNLHKSIQILAIGIGLYPFDINLYIKKADVLIIYIKDYHKKNYEREIIQILDKAELYDPHDFRIYILKSEYYQYINMYEKAIYILNKAIKLTDNRDMVYVSMANIYIKMENYNKAISYIKAALKHNPDNEEAPIMLQEAYLAINHPEQAKSFLEKFITDINAYSFSAWFALGYNYTCLNEHDKALVCYDYALAINSKYFEATLYKINSLIKLNKYEEALELLQLIDKYINIIDDSDLVLIAGYYKTINHIKKAREYYRKILSNNKYNASALYGMALTYVDYSYKIALKYLKQACKIDPDNTFYLLALANIESEMGNISESNSIYYNLTEKEPYNIEIWIEYLEFLYDKYDFSSNADTKANEIITVAAKALKYNSNSCQLYYILARISFILKNYSLAQTYLQTAVSIDSNYINIFFEKIPYSIIQDASLSNVLAKMIKTITDPHSKII